MEKQGFNACFNEWKSEELKNIVLEQPLPLTLFKKESVRIWLFSRNKMKDQQTFSTRIYGLHSQVRAAAGFEKWFRLIGWSLLLFTFSSQAWPQANFVEPGQFTVLKACKAYSSFHKGTGEAVLQVDRRYTAYGENRSANASHTLIDVDGKRKWVSLECGNYRGAKPAFTSQSISLASPQRNPSKCLPFFDDSENSVVVGVGGRVDITPVAPPIAPFGEAVNKVCGASGKTTTREEFRQLFREHPDVLAELMAYTGGKVFASRPARHDFAIYLNDLTEAWYAIRAFDHIFCGEPKSSDSIGGLHYHGRYQQLQARKEVCRLPNYERNEVVPGSIYTIGVKMKREDGGWAEFATKGYGLTLSAEDIVKVATRAFAENPIASNNSTACLVDVADGDVKFKAVFVRRASGIRTFFPDATPDTVRTLPCAEPAVLPEAAAATGP